MNQMLIDFWKKIMRMILNNKGYKYFLSFGRSWDTDFKSNNDITDSMANGKPLKSQVKFKFDWQHSCFFEFHKT